MSFRIPRLLLALMLLSCSFAFAAPVSWTPVGPNGGDARSLTFDPKNPDRIYAGTSAGELFVSNDFGKSWERFARIGKGDDYVLDNLGIDPKDGTMYVAAWTLSREGGALFRSKDHGKTWQALPGMQNKSIRAMSLAPSDPKTIIVGALDGVFRSRDGGESWEHISPPNYAELKNVESIAVDPTNPDVIYAGTWHLPWKTSDGGKTWKNIKNGVIDDSDVFSIIIDPKAPSVVYASACSGIYKSESAGDLFHKVQGIPYTARRTRVLQQDPIRRDVVYAGTTEGLWQTADAGKSWRRLTPANVIVNDVLIDPRNYNHVLLATDRGGILVSENAGENFVASNKGYTHRQVATVEAAGSDPKTFYVGVLNDKEYGGVFVTHDLGNTWEQMSTGLGGRDVFVLRQTGPDQLVAGTNQGMFLWTGAGEWHPANDIVRETKIAARASKSRKSAAKSTTKLTRSTLSARVNDIDITPSRWFAATTSGLYVSRDHARTWEQMTVPQISDVISVASRADTYLVASRNTIAVSSDGGNTWEHPRLPNVNNIVSVAIAPDDSLWAAGREGAFRSTDRGQTWTYLWNLPLTQIAHLGWNDGLNRMLATGVDSTDLYQSADGKTWTKIPAGWLLRDVTSTSGRVIAATAFDGVVLQPSSMVSQNASQQPSNAKTQVASRR